MTIQKDLQFSDLFLKVLDNSLNGTMVLTSIRNSKSEIIDFEWQLINSQAANIIGKDPSDLVGKRLLEEMPHNSKQKLFDQCVKVVDSGESQENIVQYTETNPNKWFRQQAVKLEDGLIVKFLDITDLKTVEAELTRKERLLSESQDLANMGSWSWDLNDGQVIWSENVYKIFGYADKSIIPSYEYFMGRIVPEDRERIEKEIETAVKNSESYEIGFKIEVGDNIKHLEARAIPKLDEQQNILQYIGVVRDVTLEKTQEATVQKSRRRLRRIEKAESSANLARAIAHEIRNPLTNINLAAEQLRSEPHNDNRELFLDMISRNGERIEGLIKEFMNSVRSAELNLKKHNIHKILDEALNLATDRIKLTQVKVIKKYSEDKKKIKIDAEKVRIALLNILINAIEAVEENSGEVIIETKLTDTECTVSISDNGMGIAKEQQSHLFDPFFTGKNQGLGLGLTTTLNIINSHDGNIEIDSKVGMGTKVDISFKR